jgi:hypothetical protein
VKPPPDTCEPEYIALWHKAQEVLDKNRIEYVDPEKEAAIVASTIHKRLENQ